ncbi:hypothetical protein BBJ28_00006994, partial [Nothophytophthora sp. Chile5]
MASVHGPTRRTRVRQGASMGQIPLSSGEIELYSRQDETARRRRRLLAVRDQERRIAQQVTQRYRANLQKLQGSKAQSAQRQLNVQQEALLSELHRRYQNSLQSMGTAQRNARDKLLELMEQAQLEKEKWRYNQRVTGKQRVEEAEQVHEEDEAVRLARRREVEENLTRLKELSGKQRAYASARARKEQEVALQRAKDREEAERLRRMHAPEEVFVTPRPHEKDLLSYQFTRTHCLALPTPEVAGSSTPAVTVIRHNTRHPTALNGADEASKYRDEVDQTRERDRLVKEEQEGNAAERGEGAMNAVTSRQKGQQALEWLALVDKMERRERVQHFGEGEDRVQDAVHAEERDAEQPERMTERAFARMFDLDEEESVDLSAFSIDTDEGEQPVGPAPTVYRQPKDDRLAGSGDDYRVKLKAVKSLGYPDSAESLDGKEPGDNGLDASGGRAKFADDELEKNRKQKPVESPELDSFVLKKKTWNFGTPSEGKSGSEKRHAEERTLSEKLRKVAKDRLAADEEGDNERQSSTNLRWDQRKRRTVDETRQNPPIRHSYGAENEVAADSTQGQRRQSNRSLERAHERSDAEAEDVYSNLRRQRDHTSIEQLDKRLEEVFLNLQSSTARHDGSASTASRRSDDPISLSSSGSESGHRVVQLDEGTVRSPTMTAGAAPSQTSRHGSDRARDTSVVSLPVASGESALSLSAASASFAASEAHTNISSHREKLVATEQDLREEERLADTNRASLSGTSFASSVNRRLDGPVSDVEHDSQSNASERSFASGSSLSMDAHFNYLVNMTTTVGKSLPLHLRLPAMIYGKKDMTKPPAPMAWSTSSESSLDNDRRAAPKVAETISQTGREPSIRSSLSESLEEQVEPPSGPKLTNDEAERQERGSDAQKSASVHRGIKVSDGSSASDSDSEMERSEPMALKSMKGKVARLPPPPLGSLDMSQPPVPLQQFSSSSNSSRSSSARYSEDLEPGDQSRGHASRRSYEAEEEERKADDSSSSGAASPSESSSSEGSSVSFRQQQRPKKAERIVVPGHDDDKQEGQKLSLAEAFQRRHPSFQRRVESHQDRLKRQRAEHREQQQQNDRQQPTGRPAEAERGSARDSKASNPRVRSAVASPPPLNAEKQELLGRLATGARAKISSHEMKERSRRLYHQLPEVVERKRQEEMLRRRRQRLNELREQEQVRRQGAADSSDLRIQSDRPDAVSFASSLVSDESASMKMRRQLLTGASELGRHRRRSASGWSATPVTSQNRGSMLRTSVRRLATAAAKQTPSSARPKHHKKKSNRFAKAGLPLLLFIVGGYVGLTQFVGGKFEARDHLIKSQSERVFDLEEEHKVWPDVTPDLLLDSIARRTNSLLTLLLHCCYTDALLQKITKKLVLDDFELKPVPKPKG